MLTNYTYKFARDGRNYLPNISRTFQETIVQGICGKIYNAPRVNLHPNFDFPTYSSSPQNYNLTQSNRKTSTWSVVNLQKCATFDELLTGTRDMFMCYWSADTLF